MLDYSVDSDAASPRACFQFSEKLPAKRTDFSPFVAVAGMDKPALSADDKQLCVERAEARDAQHDACARAFPRPSRKPCRSRLSCRSMCATGKPFARFTSKAYILPRTGQRGIPVVSVTPRW